MWRAPLAKHSIVDIFVVLNSDALGGHRNLSALVMSASLCSEDLSALLVSCLLTAWHHATVESGTILLIFPTSVKTVSTAEGPKVSVKLSDCNTITSLADRHSLKEETYASNPISTEAQRNPLSGKLVQRNP
jgi:hypothetical protein